MLCAVVLLACQEDKYNVNSLPTSNNSSSGNISDTVCIKQNPDWTGFNSPQAIIVGNEPLVYVAGTEFAANNVAVYSEDRPHVIVHGDLKLSPWIDPKDLSKRGAIVVLDPGLASDAMRNELSRLFPGAEFQHTLFLPRATLVPRTPFKIDWAIVPPQR